MQPGWDGPVIWPLSPVSLYFFNFRLIVFCIFRLNFHFLLGEQLDPSDEIVTFSERENLTLVICIILLGINHLVFLYFLYVYFSFYSRLTLSSCDVTQLGGRAGRLTLVICILLAPLINNYVFAYLCICAFVYFFLFRTCTFFLWCDPAERESWPCRLTLVICILLAPTSLLSSVFYYQAPICPLLPHRPSIPAETQG